MQRSTAGDTRVRFATAEDLRALHALIERAYRGDSARLGWTHEADLVDGERTTVEELAAIVDDPGSRILVIEDAHAFVGCVHVRNKAPGLCYLGMLCVDPRRQAGGIGKHLIAAAERTAVELFGATRIEMTVIDRRAELIAYYERCGYARTGERRPFPLPVVPVLEFAVLRKPLTRGPSFADAVGDTAVSERRPRAGCPTGLRKTPHNTVRRFPGTIAAPRKPGRRL
jgi:ribosomal protein S18 acetylase RimI-like enzyme